MFSGSYSPDDVTFLLKRVELGPTPLLEKERLIQSGRKHYSEMIGVEHLPSPAYLRVFHDALARQKTRFAHDLLALASLVAGARSGPIALLSLARAGTPVGVLLTRLLRRHLGRDVAHYSVSIIRDRGLDEVALRWVLARHTAETVAFVDGWTGKGVIAVELEKSVRRLNAAGGVRLDPGLFVVADLCGQAACAATDDDYLIPSCVLGCTVSGLVSRSILNDAVIGPGDFHGCVYYDEYRDQDLSRPFVDTVSDEASRLMGDAPLPAVTGVSAGRRAELRADNDAFLQEAGRRFSIRDINHIKPGIGEATRVLLRRVPDRLLLRDPNDAEVTHLRVLAEEKRVPVFVDSTLPYRAAALIKEVGQ